MNPYIYTAIIIVLIMLGSGYYFRRLNKVTLYWKGQCETMQKDIEHLRKQSASNADDQNKVLRIELESRADHIQRMNEILGYDNADGFHSMPCPHDIARTLVKEHAEYKDRYHKSMAATSELQQENKALSDLLELWHSNRTDYVKLASAIERLPLPPGMPLYALHSLIRLYCKHSVDMVETHKKLHDTLMQKEHSDTLFKRVRQALGLPLDNVNFREESVIAHAEQCAEALQWMRLCHKPDPEQPTEGDKNA